MQTHEKDRQYSQVYKKAVIKKIRVIGLFHFLKNLIVPKKKPQKKMQKKIPIDFKKKSINDISREDCMGCGLCYSICPYDAISLSHDDLGFVPQLDEDKCTSCSKCYRTCPGINILTYPDKLGDIQNIYVTHSKDPRVRYSASSGGTCRSILRALLEKKLVDKVIITRATDNPYVPETIITSSIDDLATDQLNSIYSPTKPMASLKNIDTKLKYAIVGLPCHIAGLRLSKDFKNCIFVSIGIFCSHTPSYKFLDTYLKDLPLREQVQRLSFRGSGWPGKSTVYYKTGDSYGIWFPAMWNTYNEHKKFQLPRCSTCTYYSAEFADISIGDPWSLVREDNQGLSLVLVRSDHGKDVLNSASSLISITDVKEHQRENILKFHVDSATLKQMNC